MPGTPSAPMLRHAKLNLVLQLSKHPLKGNSYIFCNRPLTSYSLTLLLSNSIISYIHLSSVVSHPIYHPHSRQASILNSDYAFPPFLPFPPFTPLFLALLYRFLYPIPDIFLAHHKLRSFVYDVSHLLLHLVIIKRQGDSEGQA